MSINKRTVTLLASLVLAACGGDDDATECVKLAQDSAKQSLAKSYCEKAANAGDPISQYHFARLLLNDGYHDQAVKHLEKSASTYAEARTLLGELYENGRLQDDENKTNALFYYRKGCELNDMNACRKANLLEKGGSENERQAKEAEEKAYRELEAQQLEYERQQFEVQKAEEEKRLAEERKKLAEQKKAAEKATISTNNTDPATFFMTHQDVQNAYKDVVATVYRERSLKDWVETCYARSNMKRGCFHFDQLVSLLEEEIAKINESSMDPYFGDSRIRNRALRNVPEFQHITTAQFNRIVADAREKLSNNFYLFGQYSEQQELAKSRNSASTIINAPQPVAVTTPTQTFSNRTPSSQINTAGLTFNEGLARFEENGLHGFADKNGNVVIRPQFTSAGGFYNGRAVVKNHNNLWGYIDKSGKWVIQAQYCMAGRFSEGLAGVYVGGYRRGDECYGGKWGYITPSGKFAIDPVLDSAVRFEKDKSGKAKAKVTYQGRTGYIDGSGKWVN